MKFLHSIKLHDLQICSLVLNGIEEEPWKCFVQGIAKNKHTADKNQEPEATLSRIAILVLY